MSDEQFYNGIENYGFGELPDTMEDLVEAMEVLQADIATISEQIDNRKELGYDVPWMKRAFGARMIKRKQRAVLRGHKVWMEKEDKSYENLRKLRAVLGLLRKNAPDIHAEALEICKAVEIEVKEELL